jgi:general secretion pathway protein G
MSIALFLHPLQMEDTSIQISSSVGYHRKAWSEGFTIMELMIVVAIISTLAAIAIPSFISSRYKAKIAVAISEIKMIEKGVLNYLAENGEYPDSLSVIGMDQITDPWGNPYNYLRIDGGTTPGLNGKRRRDKNANPVNSDFDLYSMGRDGRTQAQFNGKKARDDIVRANNGRFCDLAEKH